MERGGSPFQPRKDHWSPTCLGRGKPLGCLEESLWLKGTLALLNAVPFPPKARGRVKRAKLCYSGERAGDGAGRGHKPC